MKSRDPCIFPDSTCAPIVSPCKQSLYILRFAVHPAIPCQPLYISAVSLCQPFLPPVFRCHPCKPLFSLYMPLPSPVRSLTVTGAYRGWVPELTWGAQGMTGKSNQGKTIFSYIMGFSQPLVFFIIIQFTENILKSDMNQSVEIF